MRAHNVKQNTPEWELLRAGKPTMSEGNKLVTSVGEPSKSMVEYAKTLAAEKYAGRALSSFHGNSSTDRGHTLEPDAAEMYSFMRDVEVFKVGFITDDEETYGCSPDRGVGENGMIEIKCLETKGHIDMLLYYQKNKKPKSTYIVQPQGQMMTWEKEWCDLVFYHPELPTLIIRQEPDDKIIVPLKRQIEIVCGERDKILTMIKEI
ncbi:MAG: YqaJ viral recombinase family protein [Desulfobacterales bacterium]